MDQHLRQLWRRWLQTKLTSDKQNFFRAAARSGQYCWDCLDVSVLSNFLGICEYCERPYCQGCLRFHYPTSKIPGFDQEVTNICTICNKICTNGDVCCSYQTFCSNRHIDPVCKNCCERHINYILIDEES